jgi:DNA polymerase III subunit alpha
MDGLFQVESSLYVSLFKRLPPKRFSDIVASIALNRPGPLESGMVDDYVNVASGKVEAHYYDDRLRDILQETYGTMVYQEQIMQISMAMSGFSAGKADKLRKAMGKKKLDVMQELKEDWNNGAVENGFSLEVAKQIWDDAEKFAKYAFNKSHSAAYAVLVMRTAYMKAYYPNDYMAAVLSSYMGKTDKLIKYISSANRNGTPVLPPDINQSNVEFTPVEDGIRFGLNGIKGVGEAVANAIIAEREKSGPYTSMHDLMTRVDASLWNKKSIEALIKSGAFDSTGYTRKQLNDIIYQTNILEDETKRQRNKSAGQTSIFDLAPMESDTAMDVPAPDGIEWPNKEKNNFEKEFLGLYVSDHPLRGMEKKIESVATHLLGDLAEASKPIRDCAAVGIVSDAVIKSYTNKDGKAARRCSFVLEDTSGCVNCVTFNYDKYQTFLENDAVVLVKGKYDINKDFGNQLIVNKVEPFDIDKIEIDENLPEKVEPRHATFVDLHLRDTEFQRSTVETLSRVLQAYPGQDTIRVHIKTGSGKLLETSLPIKVNSADDALFMQIDELFGRKVTLSS